MSVSQPHSTGAGRTSSEAFLRVLFGIVLAVIAVALTIYSAEWFSVVTVLMILFGAREWHRMVRSPARASEDDQQPVLIIASDGAGSLRPAVVDEARRSGVRVVSVAIGNISPTIQERNYGPKGYIPWAGSIGATAKPLGELIARIASGH